MKPRQEMIEALTRFELQFFIDNPELLNDMVSFFDKGGYTKETDESL